MRKPPVYLTDPVSIKALAAALAKRPCQIMADLLRLGLLTTNGDELVDFDTVAKVAQEYGVEVLRAGSAMYTFSDLLNLVIQERAAELRITSGEPPAIVVRGEVHSIEGPPVPAAEAQAMLKAIATEAQMRELDRCGDLKSFFGFGGRARFMLRVAISNGHLGLVVRNLGVPTA